MLYSFFLLAILVRNELALLTFFFSYDIYKNKPEFNRKYLITGLIILIIGIALWLTYHYKITGRVIAYSTNEHKIFVRDLGQLGKNLHYQLFNIGQNIWLNVLNYAIIISLLISRVAKLPLNLKSSGLIVYILTIILSWIFFFASDNQVHNIMGQNSLLLSCPVLILLLTAKTSQPLKILSATLVLLALLAPEYSGVHWSARFLLPVIPLLMFNLQGVFKGNYINLALLVLTFLIQVYGVSLLFQRKNIQSLNQEFFSV